MEHHNLVNVTWRKTIWAILIANPHCLFWRVNYYFFGYISIIPFGVPFYRNPMKSTNLYIYMWYTHHIPILHPNDPTKNSPCFSDEPPMAPGMSGSSPPASPAAASPPEFAARLPTTLASPRPRCDLNDAHGRMVFKRSNMGGFAYQKWRSNTGKMEESWKHGDKTP